MTLGIGFLAFALACTSLVDHLTPSDFAVALPLITLYALAYRTEFVSTSGSAVPTEPVLVAMLLLLPLPLVPLTVLLALQFGGAGALRSGSRYDATVVQWATGWHCVGPVAVLFAAGPDGGPGLAHGSIYLVALAAQFAVDAAVAAVRTLALGVPLRRLVRPLGWTFAVDSLLAPIGLCIVIAGGRSPVTILLLAAPVGLIRLLARDRTEHLAAAVSLSTAFTAVNEEARVDPRTGLANRRAWEETVQAAAGRLNDGSATGVTVLAADLDGLKRVNDTYGHEAGDALIIAMAEALRAAVPQAVVVARLGGDEYALLVVDPTGTPGADPQQLIAAVRTEMARFRGPGGALAASLGTATCPPAGSVEEAVRTADARAGADKIERRANRR